MKITEDHIRILQSLSDNYGIIYQAPKRHGGYEIIIPDKVRSLRKLTKVDARRRINSEQLFLYWNDLKIIVHRGGTKTHKIAIGKLNKYLKTYSPDCIKKAMRTYKKLLDDPNTLLRDESPFKIGLDQFFSFNEYGRDQVKNWPVLRQRGIKSWFNECKQGHMKARLKWRIL